MGTRGIEERRERRTADRNMVIEAGVDYLWKDVREWE